MGKMYDHIPDDLAALAVAQPVFFVATAPLAGDGLINLSPKGLDTFRVLSPTRVAYLDLTGSGNETAANLHENGRVTFMFCSFDAKPLILRFYGRGRAVLPDDAAWPELIAHFEPLPGLRQILLADITMVQTSCGFGVPVMRLDEPRDTLVRYGSSKGEDKLREYRQEHNARSLNGLPAPGFADAG